MYSLVAVNYSILAYLTAMILVQLVDSIQYKILCKRRINYLGKNLMRAEVPYD